MSTDEMLPAAITSDNTHLAEPIWRKLVEPSAAICNPHTDANTKVLEFLQAAHAANTRRAYKSDVEHFLAWGGRVPASDQLIARYLATEADRLAIATLARRLVAIRSVHDAQGLPDPTKSELVRLTFRGIRRKYRRPQRQVAALSIDDLHAIFASLGPSIKDVRDAAILLVGFAGGFRRSELVALDHGDVEAISTGLLLRIRRSKTDQEGVGRTVVIPQGQGELRPAEALQRWLMVARIENGPVFRRVTKKGDVLRIRMSDSAIASVIKQRIQGIGSDPSLYSGHSLRAGFVTTAIMAQIGNRKIRSQTGHSCDALLERYARKGCEPLSDFNSLFEPQSSAMSGNCRGTASHCHPRD